MSHARQDPRTTGRDSGADLVDRRRRTRQEQKEQTRRALLEAALRRLAEQSLNSLSVREVTRAVGIAPAAFYRHFRDMSDLGVALVEEALGSLHAVIRQIMAELDDSDERIDHAVELIAGHVRAHPTHIRFLIRERHGGVRAVRAAIAAELDRFAREVAEALAGDAVTEGWSPDEVRTLAELYVDHMVMTAGAFLVAADGEGRDEAGAARTARTQLRLIHQGAAHYRPESPG